MMGIFFRRAWAAKEMVVNRYEAPLATIHQFAPRTKPEMDCLQNLASRSKCFAAADT